MFVFRALEPDPAPGVACRLLTRFGCGGCPTGHWSIWHDDMKEQHYYEHRCDDRPRPDLKRALDDWQLGRDFAADIYAPIHKFYGPFVHPPVGARPFSRRRRP